MPFDKPCHMYERHVLLTIKLLTYDCSLDSVLKIHRYEIIEEIGCIGSPAPFGLSLLLICFPAALAPLASLVLYCRECINYDRSTWFYIAD